MMSGLYLVLWAFGYQINYQWNSWLWRSIFDEIAKKFDSNYFAELEINIEEKTIPKIKESIKSKIT